MLVLVLRNEYENDVSASIGPSPNQEGRTGEERGGDIRGNGQLRASLGRGESTNPIY